MALSEWVGGALDAAGAPDWATSFVCDGIISGVGSVVIFLPNVVLLFLPLAILEDSGYLARVAMIIGLLAKEVMGETFGTLFGVGEEELGDVLVNVFTPLSAYSFRVFVLRYMRCLAAMLTIKQETTWRFVLGAADLMCAVAWVVSCIMYQGSVFLGFG